MKYTCILLMAALVSCRPSSVATTEGDIMTKEEALALLDRWEDAMIKKDSSLLGKVLHEDYQYSGSADGSTSDRQAMMAYTASDPSKLLGQEFYDMDIDLFDDVAIVRGWEILSLETPKGDTVRFKLRFTDVYQKKNGITRALATHSSPMD